MARLSLVILAALALSGCADEREPPAARPSQAPAQERVADAARERVAAAARERVADAPPELRRLAAEANDFLPGGAPAFERRLRALRGHPVVVNKWASWCGPCRKELPVFGDVATDLGAEVAFLGVNSLDSAAAAARFVSENPVPYPHFADPEGEVAKVFRGNAAFPTTAFYDSRGRFQIALQKPYRDAAELRRDIERYAR